MDAVFIPNEQDFKRWIRDAIKESLAELLIKEKKDEQGEPLLSRKEIAVVLKISLVTLTDWVKRGLPSHKQRGRVYFIRSEVVTYLKKNPLARPTFKSRFAGSEQ